MKKIVTFGEIMGRLTTPGFKRFCQSCPGTLNMSFAGAEANVAVSLSILGRNNVFVSAVPANAISDACIANLKSTGVTTNHILKTSKGRLGLFFVETGANQRPSRVIYDRAHSSISLVEYNEYDWDEIFDGAQWFHITGITPALSKISADVSIAVVQTAKKKGLKVSCDLNFRKKLWKWDTALSPNDLAEKTMRQMLPFVDVLIGNEEDAEDVLKIKAGNTNVDKGNLAIDRYPEVASKITTQFPNISKVAFTLRQSISATHNNWGGMLFDAKEQKAYFAPYEDGNYRPYEIRAIVDRVGGGDSFSAGLIYALTDDKLCQSQQTLSFAAASSCLAHSIEGDLNYTSREEIESLMRGSASGRVIR